MPEKAKAELAALHERFNALQKEQLQAETTPVRKHEIWNQMAELRGEILTVEGTIARLEKLARNKPDA